MTRPIITGALIIANVAIYAAGLSGGLVPAHPTASSLLSSMFLHADSMHLAGNMAFLLVAGSIVEPELGHLRFLGLYLAAGVVGALVHVLVDPSSTDPLMGASGAVCGLLAVMTVLRPRTLGFVVALVALNVWYAFSGTGGNVSFGGHIGGFAVGAAFAVWTKMTSKTAVGISCGLASGD